MHIDIEYLGDLSCDIHADTAGSQYVGTLRYKGFEIGQISTPEARFLRAQFQSICEMTAAGAMVRRGIILTGYHNRKFCGDVLLVDGEVIGEWASDEFEWCYFTAIDGAEVTLTAPSPWMLHDAIADWKAQGDASDQT